MKSWKWSELNGSIGQRDVMIFRGLWSPELKLYIRENKDFLYLDNPYFHRGPRGTKFRMIRGALHLTYVLDRPDDRIKALGVVAQPWREPGKYVVIIPPSKYHLDIYDSHGWIEETVDRIRAVTKRPITIKWDKKEPLQPVLDSAWCVVTYGSVAGVEAAVYGVPVFSGPICPSLPVSSGPVENIENPLRPDRGAWLNSLAYAQYDISELDSLLKHMRDYQYRCE